MKTRTLGTVLIFIGIAMIAYTGFNLVTTEKVIDVGPIYLSKENNHPVQWSPIVGAVILISGIVVVFTSGRTVRT